MGCGYASHALRLSALSACEANCLTATTAVPRLIGGVLLLRFCFGIAVVKAASPTCTAELAQQIPARSAEAPTGSALVKRTMDLNGKARDTVVSAEVLSGNIPSFLRHLMPVQLSGKRPDGSNVQVTICVTPDYLSIGNNRDFVRIPMGLPAAAEIADRFGFLLPTTRMVDAIYSQAGLHLEPSPMEANSLMRSTKYLWLHNQTVERQCAGVDRTLNELIAGQKKDLVLSNRLRTYTGRVAIYGWHRMNGVPIQPLSTVHGAQYADYSHGVRLVSTTAFVNGVPQPLEKLLQDPRYAWIVSSEGPIVEAGTLQASLCQQRAETVHAVSLRSSTAFN